MRILVVDDSSTMRRIIINTLQKLGHRDTVEATNGREGLERLAADKVDVVITDWNMPEMSGIEFVKSVRTSEQFASLPVVMVTTSAAKDDIVQALQAGVTNYVVKPFTTETMQEKLDAALVK